MKTPLTPRRRVEIALGGGRGDRVPFTMYENKVPQCAAERELRNRGLCIVNRVGVFKTHRPNVTTRQEVFWRDGRRMVRTVHATPAGTLTALDEPAGFTTWHHQRLFKTPDDYKAIRAFLADERHEPDYEAFAAAERAFGGDAIFRAGFGYEPFQELVSGAIMSTEQFCIEWMERRDEVLALYELLVANRRKVYPMVAGSPASHANYGGNVTPEIIGPEVFRRYYLPHYAEAAEAMHRRGKLIGCHFDANCRLLADAIASTDLDYVEAFTPAPDTDMTLAQARAAWPGKVLWINFPSSVHLRPDAEVQAATLELLDQAGPPDGLLVGITEDLPAHRWPDCCRAIMDGLDEHARQRPELYV